MKKSVLKITLQILLVVSVLLLVSCRGQVAGGAQPQDTAAILKAVQTGSQGVVLSTVPRFPPDLIYDQNELVAMVEVRNRGNHDLDPQECFVQITGFDPNIIRGGWQNPRSCAENNAGALEGKNVYNLEGGVNQIEYRSNVQLPEGVFEYNPNVNIVACYSYHTKANPQVCVDPLIFQVTSEQKTCIPTSISMAGGQGAPVGVTYVGVNMVGTKAIFEINIANVGTGRVISPNAQLQSCGSTNLEYRDLDKVSYSVQLSGGSLVDCKPHDNYVQLVNNQGKIICSYNIPVGSAYETPLMIDLDYGYIDSILKPIRIVKTPQ